MDREKRGEELGEGRGGVGREEKVGEEWGEEREREGEEKGEWHAESHFHFVTISTRCSYLFHCS